MARWRRSASPTLTPSSIARQKTERRSKEVHASRVRVSHARTVSTTARRSRGTPFGAGIGAENVARAVAKPGRLRSASALSVVATEDWRPIARIDEGDQRARPARVPGEHGSGGQACPRALTPAGAALRLPAAPGPTFL